MVPTRNDSATAAVAVSAVDSAVNALGVLEQRDDRQLRDVGGALAARGLVRRGMRAGVARVRRGAGAQSHAQDGDR